MSENVEELKREDVGVWGNFVKCITEYANFKGRADRYEYWSFLLVKDVILFVAGMVSGYFGISWLVSICGLFFILPYLGVLSRRMHDQDKSLLRYLMVPLLLLVLFVLITFFGGMAEYIFGQLPTWFVVIQKASFYIFVIVFLVVSLVLLYYAVRCGEMKDNQYGKQIPFDERLNEKGRMVMIAYFIYYLAIMFIGAYMTGINV